jgi:cytochrome c biogenesis protein CcdA/thiol-disulfide isomerase/thioredoxin
MLLTALVSFVAGLLTAFAPCVLPLLPVILGGSFNAEDKDKKRPYIIVASLAASLVLFTLLLKASTVLIGVDPKVWTYLSGGLVVALGLFMLFPNVWAKVIGGLGFEHRSQALLGKAFKRKNGTISAILTGAALGPVFSSCSPTYAWVIATVLPSSAFLGMFYLGAYVLGVSTSLLAIALLGRRLLAKVSWASNPHGWFQRLIALLFIVVGLFVITGWDKKIQTFLVEKDFTGVKLLEEKLVPAEAGQSSSITDTDGFNVQPYPAAEFVGLSDWLNSESLAIKSLRGKVVLVDFWTYSCINCIRTQPYLNSWHDKYAKDGLVIVGVHAPEFAFEKVPKNVSKAVADAQIKYPVALDNNFSTWQAYKNKFWPAKYLIDKDGQVRYTHFGEGEYDKTEELIQNLLQEAGKNVSLPIEKSTSESHSRNQTPETYLGYERGERFANAKEFVAEKPVQYGLVENPNANQWSLGGLWQVNDESSQSLSDSSSLTFAYQAKEVYLVMSGPPGSKVTIKSSLDGNAYGQDVAADGTVTLDEPRLYRLLEHDSAQKAVLTLTIPTGVTVNAFTFGS